MPKYYEKQQAHSSISRFITHKHTPWTGIPFQQPVWLMPINSHFGSSGERENAERRCERGSPRVHACVSSRAATRCVWWKAPDVARLLRCNKKAQLGQKAKVADGREKRVKGIEKGTFLKRSNRGVRLGCECLKGLVAEGKLNTESSGERQTECWVAKNRNRKELGGWWKREKKMR